MTSTNMITELLTFVLNYSAEKVLDRIIFTTTLKSKIEEAYQRALKKWSKNDIIRDSYKKQLSRIDDFRQYILTGKNIPNNELKSLFNEFENELKEDSHTYNELNYLLSQHNNAKIKELSEINQELSNQIQNLQAHINNILLTQHIFRELDYKAQTTFSPIENYIPRTCSLYEMINPLDQYFSKESHSASLVDFILGIADQHKKYVLRGDAQCGKTTELLNMAWQLSQNPTFKPLFYEVKEHTNLETTLPELSHEEQQTYVVIIDALDERFDAQSRQSLFHFLNGYAKRNPNLRMVLSCRSNFKETDSLDQYVQLCLNNLSWHEMTSIVKSTATRPDELLSNLNYDFWDNLSSTPFYLNAVIKKHNEDQQLLTKRASIYDYLVELRFRDEENKNLSLYGISRAQCEIILQQIAVVSLLTEINFITIDDIRQITSTDELTEKILRTGLLQSSSQQNCYEFIHNSYKEYFISRYLLSCKSLTQIQSICCCKNTTIIKSTWYNAAILFVSQLESQHPLFNDIISWLNEENNREILVYIDQNALEADTKAKLFVSFFDFFKNNNIAVHILDNDWCRAFMHFCCSSATINYLIEELKNANTTNQQSINIFRCLSNFDWQKANNRFHADIQNLENQMYQYLSTHLSIDSVYWLLEPFANRFFKSSPIIGEIYNLIKDHEQPNVINSFLDIVLETKQAETYLDYTLQKCHFIRNYSDNGSTHLVTKVYLLNVFKAVESPDGLIKIFTFFSKEADYDNNRDHFFNDSLFLNTLSLLLERVKENSIEERLHQEIISCYMNSLPLFIFMPYQTKLYKTYLPFIKEHNWSDEIFTTTIDNFCTNNYSDIDSTAFYLSLLLDENEKVDEIRERIKDNYKCWLLLSLMSKHIDEESIKNHIEGTSIFTIFAAYLQTLRGPLNRI